MVDYLKSSGGRPIAILSAIYSLHSIWAFSAELAQVQGITLMVTDRAGTLRRYVPFDVVQTTRGCPFPCEFCSVSTYNGTTFRFRPVKEVIAERDQGQPQT